MVESLKGKLETVILQKIFHHKFSSGFLSETEVNIVMRSSGETSYKTERELAIHSYASSMGGDLGVR